ncbi:hypothetical protein COLO4_03531, partial [Corchorus olitorius]
MAFDTASIRFHFEGYFAGVDEELEYVGGCINNLQFDPNKLGFHEFEKLCERSGYKNVIRIFYRRPGFLLCDGLKPIINDDSILGMTGEMYLNNGFIDVYLEHGIDDVVQVELLENGPAEDHNGHEQNGGLGKDGF